MVEERGIKMHILSQDKLSIVNTKNLSIQTEIHNNAVTIYGECNNITYDLGTYGNKKTVAWILKNIYDFLLKGQEVFMMPEK